MPNKTKIIDGKTYRLCTKEELKYIAGIRQMMKVANFSALYGCGLKTYAEQMRKSNSSLSVKESKQMARKALDFKKGKKINNRFYGGTDSDAFNAMKRIIMQPVPTLKTLGTRISTALRPGVCGEDFMSARCNWVVQGSAAEFLCCLLVSVRYYADLYNLEMYFILSIHDEVHYCCRIEDRYYAAAILNMAHYATWSLFHEKWGITEMPWQRAFFEEIEARHCICKSADEDLTTPSNPDGAKEPLGETITLQTLIDKNIFNKLNER